MSARCRNMAKWLALITALLGLATIYLYTGLWVGRVQGMHSVLELNNEKAKAYYYWGQRDGLESGKLWLRETLIARRILVPVIVGTHQGYAFVWDMERRSDD